MHILVAEDEPRMAELLRSTLAEEGHVVLVATDGQSAIELALVGPLDLIVLDLMLPRVDGFGVIRRIRQNKNQTPILMLTARDAAQDVVRALDEGADDYLTKPFSLDVFLARIRAVSRRGPIPRPVLLEVGSLQLNTASREVIRDGRTINLTPREYSLLELLMRHNGRVLSRQSIVSAVWGYDADIEDNTVEVFIRLLRNKIETAEGQKLIHTVRGIGYSLRIAAHV